MVQVEKAKVKEVLHPDDALRRTRKERARHKRQVNRIVVDRNLADAKNWAIKRKRGGGKKLEKRLNTEEDLLPAFPSCEAKLCCDAKQRCCFAM